MALLPSAYAEDVAKGPWSLPVRIDDGKHAGVSITSLRMVQGPDGTYNLAWMDSRYNGTDTFSSLSTDGGETWTKDLRVDPFENQARLTPTTCDIEVDEDGFVYVSYTQWMLQQGWWRVRFARSDDGGASFRAPSDAYFIVDDSIAQEHPATAVSTYGALNILYLERTQTSSKLFLVRSDDGLNPLPPRVIEPGMPDNETHVQGDIAMDEDNNIYIAFGYRAPGEAGIKLAKKAAGSGTFIIKKVYSIVEDAPRSLRPRIAVDGEVVEIVLDPLEPEGRILHVRSDDGGDTFGSPSKVWVGAGTGEAQTNPTPAFDILGRVHMAWAQGEKGKTRIHHSLSLDGVSFTAPTQLTGAWNESDMGPKFWEDFPVIVPMADGGIDAAFVANLNGTVGVYFVKMANLPPVVEITSPGDGAQVRNTVYVQGTAADMGGTTGLVAIYVQVGDGTPKRMPGTTEWEHSFDSTEFPDGMINISAWASDGFVEGAKDNITVDVDNNKSPTMSMAKPINGTSYTGLVPVVGTAEDVEGFGDGTTLQWRFPGSEDWTDSTGWELQTDNILDFDIELDLSYLPTGPAALEVRVSDGDKVSGVESRNFVLENKPDLVIKNEWINIDLEELEHNDVVTITITVMNEGAGASGKYDVEFRRFNNYEGMTTGSNLSVDESETLVFVWEAVKGDNTLRFIVDPEFRVAELDKTNNEAEIQVHVKALPADEVKETNWMFIIAIVIVVAVVGVGGALMALKYWSTAPALEEPEVQVVYEKGGMYSEGGGEYSGADTSGRDIMDGSADDGAETGDLNEPQAPEEGGPAGQTQPESMERTNVEVRDDIDLDRGPDFNSESNEQLQQDVEIRTEKVDRA